MRNKARFSKDGGCIEPRFLLWMLASQIARGEDLNDGKTTGIILFLTLEAVDEPLLISLRQRDKCLGLAMGLLHPRIPTKSYYIK